jgi:hypothetical protein
MIRIVKEKLARGYVIIVIDRIDAVIPVKFESDEKPL